MTSASEIVRANRRDATLGKLTGLMRIAIVALFLCAVLDVVAIASDVSYQHLVDRLVNHQFVAPGDAQSADDRQSLIGLGQVLIALLAAVPFIAWFRQAYT